MPHLRAKRSHGRLERSGQTDGYLIYFASCGGPTKGGRDGSCVPPVSFLCLELVRNIPYKSRSRPMSEPLPPTAGEPSRPKNERRFFAAYKVTVELTKALLW